MNQNTSYMYSTAMETIEENRLAGLNELHNPFTLKFLRPFLSNKRKILELGCGSGNLAAEVLNSVDNKVEYIGIDRDLAQVEHSKKLLKQFSNARILHLDLTAELEKLKKEAPFDLIYCRWVLVHLPTTIRKAIIKNLLALLSDNGVFFCEECDNRNVRFKPTQSNKIVTAPFEEATKLWSIISKGLMQIFGNDLEYTPEKIIKDLVEAGNGKGEVKFEGQYQVVLRGLDQKRLITDGYRSSSSYVSQVCNKPFDEIILPFDKCVEDDLIEVEFLTENIASYQAKRS